MRGIIYCVHIFGVGHLKRMLTLARGLVETCDITLIQAGRNEHLTFEHPHFHHIKLTLSDDDLFALIKNHFRPPEYLMNLRKKELFSSLDFSQPYDFLITEQIPFTKFTFLHEAYSILAAMKVINPDAKLICSQKGGTPLYPEEQVNDNLTELQVYWDTTLKELKEMYDKVLVHCDPKVNRLEETFGYCDRIQEKIEYTGYIYPRSEKYPPSNNRKKEILITTGSGKRGNELLLTLLEVIPMIPDYRFIFITSPMMKQSILRLLHLKQKILANMQIIHFLDNFDEKLRQCSLAITLAGSTIINLYATGTPGLVYPDPGELGQMMLGKKMADENIVNLIYPGDLYPDKLHGLIMEALKHPPQSDIELNIAGVKNSIKAIEKIVGVKE